MDAVERIKELSEAWPRGMRLGVGKALRVLPGRLHPTEDVLAIAPATYGKRAGVLAVTNRRLLLVSSSMGDRASEEFALATIASVEAVKDFGRSGRLVLHTAGGSAELSSIHPKMFDDLVAQIRHAQSLTTTREPPPPPSDRQPSDPVADRLAQLQKLLESGAINQEEYEQQRQRIISEL